MMRDLLAGSTEVLPWDLGSFRADFGYYRSLNLIPVASGPTGIRLTPDGTKVFFSEGSASRVCMYPLTTAFEIGSLNSDNTITFSVVSKETTPTGLTFSPDGSKMYIIGSSSVAVHQYALGTPWGITTAVFEKSFSIGTQDTLPTSVEFKPDGMKMYITGTSTGYVYQYALSVAWDISTAVFEKQSGFSSSSVAEVLFNPTGTKLYYCTSSSMTEYSLPTPWDIGTSSFVSSTTFVTTASAGACISSDGESFYTVGLSTALQTALRSAWDISTAANRRYQKNCISTLIASETSPSSLYISGDGTRLYVAGSSLDAIVQYELSIPWDINTALVPVPLNNNFLNVAAKDTAITDIFISSSGSRLYIIGSTSDSVHAYSLPTLWAVNDAMYSHALSVAGKTTSPTGLTFSTDGIHMYTCQTSIIHQYTLPVAWGNLSTAVYIRSLTIYDKEASAQSIRFSTDGSKMFVVGSSSDSLHQYTLATAWDISTAVFEKTLYVGGQETVASSFVFSPDGKHLYVTGPNSDQVYQYTFIGD